MPGIYLTICVCQKTRIHISPTKMFKLQAGEIFFDKTEQKSAVTHWRILALDPDTETVTYTVFMDKVQWPTKVSSGVTINVLRESFPLPPFSPQWYRFPRGPVAHVLNSQGYPTCKVKGQNGYT